MNQAICLNDAHNNADIECYSMAFSSRWCTHRSVW